MLQVSVEGQTYGASDTREYQADWRFPPDRYDGVDYTLREPWEVTEFDHDILSPSAGRIKSTQLVYSRRVRDLHFEDTRQPRDLFSFALPDPTTDYPGAR